jgi:hypothetical protein
MVKAAAEHPPPRAAALAKIKSLMLYKKSATRWCR